MNLANKYTQDEIKLLESIGVNVEDKEYTSEELERVEYQIAEYIMSQSTKEDIISKTMNQYNSILNDLARNK